MPVGQCGPPVRSLTGPLDQGGPLWGLNILALLGLGSSGFAQTSESGCHATSILQCTTGSLSSSPLALSSLHLRKSTAPASSCRCSFRSSLTTLFCITHRFTASRLSACVPQPSSFDTRLACSNLVGIAPLRPALSQHHLLPFILLPSSCVVDVVALLVGLLRVDPPNDDKLRAQVFRRGALCHPPSGAGRQFVKNIWIPRYRTTTHKSL